VCPVSMCNGMSTVHNTITGSGYKTKNINLIKIENKKMCCLVMSVKGKKYLKKDIAKRHEHNHTCISKFLFELYNISIARYMEINTLTS
jgi:hypothetical protein